MHFLIVLSTVIHCLLEIIWLFRAAATLHCDPEQGLLKNKDDYTFEPVIFRGNGFGDLGVLNSNDGPPAELSYKVKTFPNTREIQLYVVGKNRREHSKLILKANPFKHSEQDCTKDIGPEEQIRTFALKHCLMRSEDPEERSKADNRMKKFHHLFTGCYYLVLMNENGTKWIHEPIFINSTSPFNDTLLREYDVDRCYDPQPYDSKVQLINFVQIPMRCLALQLQLFLNRSDRYCGREDDRIGTNIGGILADQACKVDLNESGKAKTECASNGTALTVDTEFGQNNNSWNAVISWTIPDNGYTNYCVQILSDRKKNCLKQMSYEDLVTWLPPPLYRTNRFAECSKKSLLHLQPNDHQLYWLFLATGLIMIAALGYFIKKTFDLCKRVRLAEVRTEDDHVESGSFFNETECEQILMIYAEKTSEFKTQMKNVRKYLKEHCRCDIHDLHADDEYDSVASSHGSGWAETMAKSSKIVWFDTPRFRDCASKKKITEQGQHMAGFRDTIITYLLDISTNIDRDPNTQYRRHFVVWFKGLEVIFNAGDDVLQLLTPNRRYLLPDRLPDLSRDLSAAEPLKANPAQSEAP